MKLPIGLILARGGSKGIKDKNLQEILGKSLIFRCAREAVNSVLPEVYVYSDDERIREQARLAGAIGVDRPVAVSGDDTTSEATVQRFLRNSKKLEGRDICLLQCTTPFLRTEHINGAVQMLHDPELGLDSVVSTAPMPRYLGYTPRKSERYWIPIYPYRWLRQEQGPLYHMESGGLYLAHNRIWKSGRRMGISVGKIVMDWWEAIEIDDLTDLEVARRLASLFLKEEPTLESILEKK